MNIAQFVCKVLTDLAVTQVDRTQFRFDEVTGIQINGVGPGKEVERTRRQPLPPSDGGIIRSPTHQYTMQEVEAALAAGIPNFVQVGMWAGPKRAVDGARIYDNFGNGQWSDTKEKVNTMHAPREGIFVAGWVFVLTPRKTPSLDRGDEGEHGTTRSGGHLTRKAK